MKLRMSDSPIIKMGESLFHDRISWFYLHSEDYKPLSQTPIEKVIALKDKKQKSYPL